MKFIEGRDALPYGMTVEYNAQYDYWCDAIQSRGINVVDLRETIGDSIEFYKTDHHWTVETSFFAAQNILKTSILLIKEDLHTIKNFLKKIIMISLSTKIRF